jgi:hypothetical protein
MNLYVLCGNARTFLQCFDSCYSRIINQLDKDKPKTLFFYLKLSDPGPKHMNNWNFVYKDVSHDDILRKLDEIRKIENVLVYYKLVYTNEISDSDLIKQVRHRAMYIDFLSIDDHLLRALHFFYNLESCGKYILKKEKENGYKYTNIIYITC